MQERQPDVAALNRAHRPSHDVDALHRSYLKRNRAPEEAIAYHEARVQADRDAGAELEDLEDVLEALRNSAVLLTAHQLSAMTGLGLSEVRSLLKRAHERGLVIWHKKYGWRAAPQKREAS